MVLKFLQAFHNINRCLIYNKNFYFLISERSIHLYYSSYNVAKLGVISQNNCSPATK